MITVKVNLNSIEKVKTFVNVASSVDCDIELISGKYIIDAKSIMGIFSLNLCNTLDLVIHSDDNSIAKKFESYLA